MACRRGRRGCRRRSPAFRRDRQGGNGSPAPWKGRIEACAAVGDTIHVGDEVVRYEGEELAQPATATIQRKRAVPAEAPAQPSPRKAVRAMPAVRILAAELGLNLAGIAGSGPDGTVLARDLAGALRRGRAGATELPSGVPEHADDAGWQPLSGVRRSMARNMERSRAEVAPATIHEEADVSAWVPGSDALHSSFAQFLPASRLSLHLTAGPRRPPQAAA